MAVTQIEFNQELPKVQRALRAFIMSKTGDAHDTDDVLQNTLIRAHENLGRLGSIRELSPWLYALARFEIRKHYLYEKRSRETDLASQEIPQWTGKDMGALQHFDYFMEKICATQANRTAIAVMALHLFSRYSRAEIASSLTLAHNTVCEYILEMKNKIRTVTGKPDPGYLAEMKARALYEIWCRALHPCFGPTAVHYDFLEVLYPLLEEAHDRHSGSYLGPYYLMLSSFEYSHIAEYVRTDKPILLPHEWRREWWDVGKKNRAREVYKKLILHEMYPRNRLFTDFHYQLFNPDGEKDVDWEALLNLCNRIGEKFPRSAVYWRTAYCHRALKGAKAAADYLEKYKNNVSIRGDAYNYYRLGLYNYEAGRFAKARVYFRATLKCANTNPMELYVRDLIKHCELDVKSGPIGGKKQKSKK